MIGALNTKLLRDIWNIKGQMLAIVLVMTAGISVFVIMFGVLDSLKLTKETYYDRYQFANVFSSLKRAPESIKQRVFEIPGVSIVETRVVFGVTLQIEGMKEPASGKMISIPDDRESRLNKLYLRSGRMLNANEENSILADESFVLAHNFKLGDKVSVVINGHKRMLKIVGVVLSPEYVYSIAPGAIMPDPKRFGVFWMSRRSLEAAVNMQGAFNDISIKTNPNINLDDVQAKTDQILKPYGGLISYSRKDQISNFFVENELAQLQTMGNMAPIIFLSVAAFLINVVMSRQIATQREQIGMLKAVGYSDYEISWHYLKMVLVITSFGALFGILLGAWMGAGMTKMYTEFFQFPILKYSFSPEVMIFAVLFCSFAAIIGTLFAINNAAKLPPAEAMRPASPAVFRPTIIEKLGLHKYLSFLSRIILRQLERRPIRSLFSALGMSLALSILIFSFFMEDTMSYLMEVQYDVTQREDVSLSFVESRPFSAMQEIKNLPGVLSVEPIRNVPVNLKNQNYHKRSSITGLTHNPQLRRVIDQQLSAVSMPSKGLILNDKLAKILHLNVGDFVSVEVLEGQRKTLRIPVNNITDEFIGLGAFMNIHELNKLMNQEARITGVSLAIDSNQASQLYSEVKKIPAIIGLNITSVIRVIFEELMAENLLMMMSINILFASFISFGVIYNTARIALSERGRELASLRVLGLTRKEVAYILFGELGIITLLSIPLGLFLGTIMAQGMISSFETELFRVPFYINNSTYAYSSIVILLSTIFSFYLVWLQVNQIDLVSAQKGVE